MQRRLALQHLLRGLAAGSLLGTTRIRAQQAGAPGGAGALGQRPQMQFAPLAPEVRQVLDLWEIHTRDVQRLHGPFERYVYDSTFLEEKRAVGEFWYEQPDLGRIDINPSPNLPQPDANGQRLNPKKIGANGQPYSIKADSQSKWICRGDAMLAIDVEQRTFEVVEIPPHMQGKNITTSPLPFLFGMPAQQMDQRYFLSFGPMHNPQGANKQRPVIHIVAYPKLAAAAKDWSRAEVLLDPGTRFAANGQPVYVPTAIKLLDPAGQQETVYVFKLDETKLNEKLFFGNPFKDPGLFSGYKCVARHRIAAEENDAQRTVQGADPAAIPQTR